MFVYIISQTTSVVNNFQQNSITRNLRLCFAKNTSKAIKELHILCIIYENHFKNCDICVTDSNYKLMNAEKARKTHTYVFLIDNRTRLWYNIRKTGQFYE